MKLFNTDYSKPVYQNFRKNEIFKPASVGFYWTCIVVCLIYLLCLFISPVSAGTISCELNGIPYTSNIHADGSTPYKSEFFINDRLICTDVTDNFMIFRSNPKGQNGAGHVYYGAGQSASILMSDYFDGGAHYDYMIAENPYLIGASGMFFGPYNSTPNPNFNYFVNITNNTGNVPLQVHFELTGSNIDYDNVLWNFGDGTEQFVNTASFDKFYTENGYYSPTVTGLYTNSVVFSHTFTDAIHVFSGSPTADFGLIYTNGMKAPCQIAFQDYSYPNITSWSWYTFRGLNPSEAYYSSSQTPPSNWFNTSGVWYTNLTVGNAQGYNTQIKGYYIYPDGNVTPVTPTITQTFITVNPTVYPTSIPVTTLIPDKNTVFYNVKNELGQNQPDVSIQQWEYKCGYLDFLCVFGKHPEQIDGGFTDTKGNFMALENSPANYDYKAGGNLNYTTSKTYTSLTGSYSLPPDRYINLTINSYGVDTVLYVVDLNVFDFDDNSLPLPNVIIRISEDGITTKTVTTNNNGKIPVLLTKGNYSLSISKTGYYPAIEPLQVNGASQQIYYLHAMPVIGPTTTQTIAPTPTIYNGNFSPSTCRQTLDFNNETFWSPILNIEACVGIVTPIYQNYILAALVCIVAGILISRKYNSKEGFVIGVIIGNTICAASGLISWSIWVIVIIPMALIFMYKGGK